MKQLIKNIIPFNNRTQMPKIQFLIKIVLAFFLCKFAGEIIAEAVVIAIHFAVGKNPLEGAMFDPQTITLISYYGYIIVIGITLLYIKLIWKKPLSEIGLAKGLGTYFVGAAAGAVLVVICTAAITLTGTIKYNGIFKNIDVVIILLMLGGFVFQGAVEELLCRGLVLLTLKEKTSVPTAVGVSTVLFILPHLSSLSEARPSLVLCGIVDLVLISVIFSLLTLRINSIWAACGLHTVWNFILYNILGLNLSGKDTKTAAVFDMESVGDNILNGGVYGIEASMITAVILAAAALLLWLSGRKSDNASADK